jgi:phosphatidylethanolamine-binding protein (PEBP) family uncharacterized protein
MNEPPPAFRRDGGWSRTNDPTPCQRSIRPGTSLVKAFGATCLGPRPIPGHGQHHYRFLVFALDQKIPAGVADHKALLAAMAGHVVARGGLTGTYER